MKKTKDINILHELKVKYKLIEPVAMNIENEADKRMKRIYNNTLKEVGIYSIWISIVMSFILNTGKFT